MKNNSGKEQKNDMVRIRISEQEKQKILREAEAVGMNLSQYIMHCTRHKQIIIVEGGAQLASEVYRLNQTLNQMIGNPDVPVQALREAATGGLRAIKEQASMIGRRESDHVNPEI
ncbi:plasmid mobilization protein [Selenomonas sp. KH1T6]|uniref:plasmid mobilization protein n=1 Tax=Selenomonas sp. KH1T6 TaxID=3158784 RepID=UPI0008A76B27|nr:hypothetical protein SAMN05216583_103178 [Selenomonas ruminantium]